MVLLCKTGPTFSQTPCAVLLLKREIGFFNSSPKRKTEKLLLDTSETIGQSFKKGIML